jgi:hypothetical protein
MEETSLLALPEGMKIEQIQITATGLLIQVAATTPTSRCPLCSEPSSSIRRFPKPAVTRGRSPGQVAAGTAPWR